MVQLGDVLHLEAKNKSYVSRELVEDILKYLNEKILDIQIDVSFSVTNIN